MTAPTPELGIMQGRLSPPRNGRIQSFPWHQWREEFARAEACGLQRIEWIFEAERWSDNPLITRDGQAEIRGLQERTGVHVASVCADYFLDLPLVRVDGHELEARVGMLKFLIRRVAEFGVEHIDLPLVDASSCRDDRDLERVRTVVTACLPELEKARTRLLLETDLAPARFRALLEAIGHPLVGANHDIGNSASLGFEASEELEALGAWIGCVHIKDRVRGGGTVPLGNGDADLPKSLGLIRSLGYPGALILQVARGEDEIEWTRRNAGRVCEIWRSATGGQAGGR